jgi:hypothetical protein
LKDIVNDIAAIVNAIAKVIFASTQASANQLDTLDQAGFLAAAMGKVHHFSSLFG